MRPLSRGLTLKVVVPIVLSVVAVVGGGLTWLVLQQQQQLYAEQVSRLRVYARQMETVRNYILNLQPYVQHTSADTVPMVAAIKVASLYQENFRDGTVIRTPSDKPRNPKNAADPWEKEKLERFRRNPELTELWEITTLNGEKVLRYAMPVKVTQDCLTCHGFPVGEKDPFGYPKEGYKVGDIRALYSLYIPTAAVAAQTRANLARVYGLGLALIALLALAVTVTTRRTVTKPLAAVTAQLENIARGEGDLSRRLEYASRDEVGQLAQGFNSFVAKLAEMVRAIEGVAKSVAETSSEVADASTQTGEATQDVTANLEQLVQQATTQAERLATSRNDIKVLAEASAQVAENAAEAAGLAHATAKAAGLGEEALKQAVSGMERISHRAVEAASAVRGLSERAMSIGEIVETIQAFARETNLLALNAAIEAARAGESGRGFAVVADQVRQLADDSSRAAGRIGEMIAQIQGQAKEASRVMEESTQSVEEGYRLIDKARSSLQEITGAAHKTDERMQDIRAAAERLAERVRALAEAMEGLTLAAEEISNRAANIGAAAEEQMAAVEEIGASTSSLAAEAGKLRALIERFKY